MRSREEGEKDRIEYGIWLLNGIFIKKEYSHEMLITRLTLWEVQSQTHSEILPEAWKGWEPPPQYFYPISSAYLWLCPNGHGQCYRYVGILPTGEYCGEDK